jgi:amidase
VRIAWSPHLGGLPVDHRVSALFAGHRAAFSAIGCVPEEAQPDLEGAREIFQVWRAYTYAAQYGPLLAEHRSRMKDTVVWNIEEGLRLTGPQVAEAELRRTELYQRVQRFMETYEFLVLPTTQVPPFDVGTPYVTEIDGRALPTYIDWMRSCSDITVTGLPAISVPAGFIAEGLPVGLQIVGRHQSELSVLQLARAFEQATGFGTRRPPVA